MSVVGRLHSTHIECALPVLFLSIQPLCEFYSLVPSPPTGVTVVQHGLTSIIVTWTASSDATGYRISYTSSGGDSGSADVNGDSHTLTGLVRETTYTISITATSQSLSSSPVTVEVTLSEADTSIMSSF